MKRQIIIVAIVFIMSLINMQAQVKNVQIDILYFHATIRCHACLTIEDFIKNSVELYFEKELKDSTITLKSLDFLQPKNGHYQEQYKFDTQTLIISKKINRKEVQWKNLDKIWDYENDFKKFKKYITNEIKKILGD